MSAHGSVGPTAVRSVALLDAAGAAAGDTAAVDAGDTGAGLMERAAGHLARAVVAAGGHGYGLKVTIVVGRGNNGGDGWAAARRLRDHGALARVVAPDGTEVELSAEAAANRAAWLAGGGRTSADIGDLAAALDWCDVAVDALLGTGTRGAPRGTAREAVAALRRAHAAGTTVVACDMPSGVSADDGAADPELAAVADLTVTFGGLKRGLLLHPGAAHAGRVVVGGLGPHYHAPGTGWSALTPAGAAPPHLAPATDKRARGTALLVAGAEGTSGAAALAARGALRAGAGLVTAAVPAPVRGEVAIGSDPGVMVRGLPADPRGRLARDAVHALPSVEAMDVVAAGPGLGVGDGVTDVVASLRRSARRLVLDADALNVHRGDPAALGDHWGELVLTPHRRELARIGGGTSGPDAWARRVTRTPELARELRATVVAKGPGTIVAAPDGRVWVCPLGSPALGSGGTGDVLTGIVAAAIATTDDVPLAVARAVWWHAAAGERAGWRAGLRAGATDLLDELPGVLRDLARVSAAGVAGDWTLTAGLPWDDWRTSAPAAEAVRPEWSVTPTPARPTVPAGGPRMGRRGR